MTKEEFLIESVQYYIKDPLGRRNVSEGGLCMYSPQKLTSEGCLIGRHMDLKDAIYVDSQASNIDVGFLKEEYPDCFPKKLKNFNISFLTECQMLHDGSKNWDKSGLTERGLDYLQKICDKYKLKKSTFSKCITVT